MKYFLYYFLIAVFSTQIFSQLHTTNILENRGAKFKKPVEQILQKKNFKDLRGNKSVLEPDFINDLTASRVDSIIAYAQQDTLLPYVEKGTVILI